MAVLNIIVHFSSGCSPSPVFNKPVQFLKKALLRTRGKAIRFFWLPLIIIATSLPLSTNAQSTADSKEYQIKAAYLYKFGSYVEWPEESFSGPGSPLTIGVIGADSIADNLEKIISGRTINNRSIIVRKIVPGTSLEGIQILFVGNSESGKLGNILAEAGKWPVLTVTESEESLPLGSIINFVITEDKVRFDIALDSADRINLKISSRLLEVARKVIERSS